MEIPVAYPSGGDLDRKFHYTVGSFIFRLTKAFWQSVSLVKNGEENVSLENIFVRSTERNFE